MEHTNNVIVLNVHGGIPTSMMKKAFKQLPNFAYLAENSDMYTRAYPSNAAAGPALHDIIMDAPLGSMTDSIWHDWCHVRKPTRSIFNVFKQNGYTTNLFGAFGLDRKLDPHVTMYNYPGDAQKSLEMFGIDQFETQDAAFTCQLAFAHDKDVMKRVCSFFESLDTLNFTMINLLGAQDIHKCNFDQVDGDEVAVPVVDSDDIEMWSKNGFLADLKVQDIDSRQYAENVLKDNPRHDNTTSSKIQGLQRATMLYDWLRGKSNERDKSNEQILHNVSELHRFAWKCLLKLDEGIGNMILALKKQNLLNKTIIYMTCDHPISLFEHGEICEAPWDACLRSFLVVRHPDQVRGREFDQAISLAHLSRRIMEDCNIYADWHVTVPASCVMTLGLCSSWLCRAFLLPRINVFSFKTFFMRFVVNRFGRLYSVIVWFSIVDLFESTGTQYMNMSDDEMADLCVRQTEWVNPIVGKDISDLNCIQVYDLTVDSSELYNIATPEWIRSKAANSIKNDIDYAINEYTGNILKITFPKNVHEMTPDRITFCSVQLHHKVKDRIKNEKSKIMKSIAIQTEQFSMIQLLTREFGPDFENLFAPKLQRHSTNHLTLFLPQPIPQTWPEWLPIPFSGLFTKETLSMFARYNVEMYDSNNNKVKFKKHDSGIVVHQAVISSNALSFTTIGTHYTVYKVVQLQNISKSITPASSQSASYDEKSSTNFTKESEANIDTILSEKDHERKKVSKSRNDLSKKMSTDKSLLETKGKAKTNEMRLLQKEAHR